MKKRGIIALGLAATLLLASCGTSSKEEAKEMEPDINVEEMEPPKETLEIAPEVETPGEVTPSEPYVDGFLSQLEGLVENEYPELTVEAVILERKAILAGYPVKVRIILNNTGDKTLAYVMGSGAYTVPQSLYLYSEDLQTVMPEEYYGPTTMDFRMAELAPGETKEYDYIFYTVKPTAEFQDIAFKLKQDGTYIGNTPLADLKEQEASLIPVAPGSYTGEAIFMYSVLDPAGEVDVTGNATGYTKAPITLSVSD